MTVPKDASCCWQTFESRQWAQRACQRRTKATAVRTTPRETHVETHELCSPNVPSSRSGSAASKLRVLQTARSATNCTVPSFPCHNLVIAVRSFASQACTCMTCCIPRALARFSCRGALPHNHTRNRAFAHKTFRKLAHIRPTVGPSCLGHGHRLSCNKVSLAFSWQSCHFPPSSTERWATSDIAAASSVTASGL